MVRLSSIWPVLRLEERHRDRDEEAQKHRGDQDYRHGDRLPLEGELHLIMKDVVQGRKDDGRKVGLPEKCHRPACARIHFSGNV